MATLVTNRKTYIKCNSVAEARELLQTRRDCSAGYIKYDGPEDLIEMPVKPFRQPVDEEVPTWARNRG